MSAWPMVRLGACAAIVSGSTPKTSISDYWDGDVHWATPKDLSDLDGHVIVGTARTLTAAGLRSCGASVLPSSSVLFSSRAPIGLVAVNTIPMATNQGFKSFIPAPDLLDSGYLAHWLRANRKRLESLGNGATFKEVSKAVVARVEIPLPPVSEQRRIAEVLDRADALRTKRGTALALVDGLMTAAFAETMAHAPWGGGTARPLGEHVGRITVGHVGPTSEFFSPSGVPFLRTGNIGDLEIRTADLKYVTQKFHENHMKSALIQGDVLVSRVVSDEVRCAVVPAELAGSNCANVIIIRPGERVSGEFLAYLIRSAASQRSLLGRRVGSAQSVVNTGVLQSWKVALPSIDVQEQFTGKAATARKLKVSCVASDVALAHVFASLQQRAFSGQL